MLLKMLTYIIQIKLQYLIDYFFFFITYDFKVGNMWTYYEVINFTIQCNSVKPQVISYKKILKSESMIHKTLKIKQNM